jgi:hypothetical protein
VGRLAAGSLALTSDLPVQPSELAIGLTEDDVL